MASVALKFRTKRLFYGNFGTNLVQGTSIIHRAAPPNYSIAEERRAYLDSLAASSDDVTDILVLDSRNNVTYSAKNSRFAVKQFNLTKTPGGDSNYFMLDGNAGTAFRYVKSDEFMLSSVFNTDFGSIREEYRDEKFFESGYSSDTVYLLSFIGSRDGGSKILLLIAFVAISIVLSILMASSKASIMTSILVMVVLTFPAMIQGLFKLSPVGLAILKIDPVACCFNMMGKLLADNAALFSLGSYILPLVLFAAACLALMAFASRKIALKGEK